MSVGTLYIHRTEKKARRAQREADKLEHPGVLHSFYGAPFSGMYAHTVILVDPPCRGDQEWIESSLLTRLEYGGLICRPTEISYDSHPQCTAEESGGHRCELAFCHEGKHWVSQKTINSGGFQ